MATLSAFSRTLVRPAVRAAAAARRFVARPSAVQPLAAPTKRVQRGSEFFLFFSVGDRLVKTHSNM